MIRIIYQYILEILKEGSFSGAANNLYISQSSLSRTIINYEKKLNTKIFDRTSNPIVLTLAGEKVLEYLQKSNELEKKLQLELKLFNSQGNDDYVVKIGIISWKVPIFLPKIIPEFRKMFPDIESTLTINDSVSLENLVSEDKLDVAIVNGPIKNKNLSSRELNTSKLVIIASDEISSKIGRKLDRGNDYRTVNPKDIDNENFILLREDTRVGYISRSILNHFNVQPGNIIDVDNLNSAINMVYVNIGFTFVPEYLVLNNSIDISKINIFTLDKSNFTLPLVITYKKDKINNPNIKRFVDFVFENYKV